MGVEGRRWQGGGLIFFAPHHMPALPTDPGEKKINFSGQNEKKKIMILWKPPHVNRYA